MWFSPDSAPPDRLPDAAARKRGLASNCEGAAILEFALTLPILLALVAGCFELGRALLIYQTMNEAVLSGARTLARMPGSTCFPNCTSGVERVAETTRAMISARGWVASDKVQVMPAQDAETGTVTIRVEVRLTSDVLAGFGLNRILTLSAVHQEARVEE